MEESIMELRKKILLLPMNSIVYLDIPQEDGAKMEMERIKMSAIDSLLKSYISDCGTPDEDNLCWKEIVEEYTKTFSSYMATIHYWITNILGEDIIIPLSEPCYRLGYDGIKEKIYIYKTCPKA